MNLTPTNWQEVKMDLIAKFKDIACKEEFSKLETASTFEQLFNVVFINYGWLQDRNYTIPEIENITPIQHSEFMVWLLETYCLGKDVDSVVQTVIDLHKQRISGTEPTEKQWAASRAAAWDAASRAAAWDAASRAAARDAAWDAARAAAWDAARANITNKLISIIYN